MRFEIPSSGYIVGTCEQVLRQALFTAFAGYGAAIYYGANASLATKIAIIYSLATSMMHIIGDLIVLQSNNSLDCDYEENAYFRFRVVRILMPVIDGVFIVATRVFNLIGRRGIVAFSIISAFRFIALSYSADQS